MPTKILIFGGSVRNPASFGYSGVNPRFTNWDSLALGVLGDPGSFVIPASNPARIVGVVSSPDDAVSYALANGYNVLALPFLGAQSWLYRDAWRTAYNNGILPVVTFNIASNSRLTTPPYLDEFITVSPANEKRTGLPVRFGSYGPGLEFLAISKDSTTAEATCSLATVAAQIWEANPSYGVGEVRQHLRQITNAWYGEGWSELQGFGGIVSLDTAPNVRLDAVPSDNAAGYRYYETVPGNLYEWAGAPAGTTLSNGASTLIAPGFFTAEGAYVRGLIAPGTGVVYNASAGVPTRSDEVFSENAAGSAYFPTVPGTQYEWADVPVGATLQNGGTTLTEAGFFFAESTYVRAVVALGTGRLFVAVVVNTYAVLEPPIPLRVEAFRSPNGKTVTFTWQPSLFSVDLTTEIVTSSGTVIYDGTGSSTTWESTVNGNEEFTFRHRRVSDGALSRPYACAKVAVSDLKQSIADDASFIYARFVDSTGAPLVGINVVLTPLPPRQREASYITKKSVTLVTNNFGEPENPEHPDVEHKAAIVGGSYRVELPHDSFRIEVPVDGGTYSFAQLIR